VALGDDAHRIAELGEHFQTAPRQAEMHKQDKWNTP
jgi:hypothetical protein